MPSAAISGIVAMTTALEVLKPCCMSIGGMVAPTATAVRVGAIMLAQLGTRGMRTSQVTIGGRSAVDGVAGAVMGLLVGRSDRGGGRSGQSGSLGSSPIVRSGEECSALSGSIGGFSSKERRLLFR